MSLTMQEPKRTWAKPVHVTRKVLLSIIDKTAKSNFIGFTFIKKDGSIRNLIGRFGVTKYLKGGKATLDPNKFYIIFDLQKKEYRSIDKSRILSVRLNGVHYVVRGEE